MATSKTGARHLPDDPRYIEFVLRYAFDCTRFAIEVCGLKAPTWQQRELFESVSVPGSRTSVSSGHGCFGRGTGIMLADGTSRRVEMIRKGDKLRGDDGTTRTVQSLERGIEAMWRLTYEDGTGHDFNESHILCLIDRAGIAHKVPLADYLAWSEDERAAWTAYRRDAGGAFTRLDIVEVEPLGEDRYYGFTLDGNGLFCLADGTVTSNTGKTSGFAIIALWHLLCYYLSNTFLTGPKIRTVHDGVWKEFADLSAKIETGAQSWVRDYFTIESERVFVKGYKLNWYVAPKSAPRGAPENLAGTHRDWLLWLADEASGIPDANFKTISGSLTDKRNRMALASQPTRSSGFFYDTHHLLSWAKGGVWNNLVFNSELSPIVSHEFLAEKKEEYTEEEYSIKVLGQFPENSSKYLLGRGAIEATLGRNVLLPNTPWGWILPLDVSGGGWRDYSVLPALKVQGIGEFGPDARRAQLVQVPLWDNKTDPTDLHGILMKEALERGNAHAMIDAGGMGLMVCRSLDRNGFSAYTKVLWGKQNFKKEFKDRYLNQRAQATCGLSRAVQEGRFGVDPGISKKFVNAMIEQGSRIPYHYDEQARRVIMKKEDMKKEGIPSPDIWDALSFAFLEDAHFSIADEENEASKADDIEQARAELMAALGEHQHA
jgi:hypothetical protein